MVVAVLSRPTLVLNRSWQPVGVVPVSRSISLLCNEAARVVDPDDYQQYTWEDWSQLLPRDDEPFVQSVHFRLRVPEVIVLTSYDRVPRNTVAFNRRNLYRRDRYSCQYCGQRGRMYRGAQARRRSWTGSADFFEPTPEQHTVDLTIDHVLPRSQGGTSTWENCVLACVECNSRKADRTPDQAKMPLKRKPVRPAWKPLYAWHCTRIESWSKFLSEAYWNVELEE